jgi:hypothetical protein
MSISRAFCAVVCLAAGLGVGVLWSPLPHPWRKPLTSRDLAEKKRAVGGRKLAAETLKAFGDDKEVGEFANQFKDLTIRIFQDPINAAASPDGRFVIRLFGEGDAIASDLRYPINGTVQLVRNYHFSSGGHNYSVDLQRGAEDSKVTWISFSMTDNKGRGLTYVDSDGDGSWDRLTDETHESPTFYRRDGLCWKERTKEAPKLP